jgi:hypothetical protein
MNFFRGEKELKNWMISNNAEDGIYCLPVKDAFKVSKLLFEI